mmetsp:Transcript_94094/g.303991  ORF Transcript_94094/g.303991 Transcript_94094/m.303991 type:complete len:303 (-) Transcript_94094:904-1812(-)
MAAIRREKVASQGGFQEELQVPLRAEGGHQPDKEGAPGRLQDRLLHRDVLLLLVLEHAGLQQALHGEGMPCLPAPHEADFCKAAATQQAHLLELISPVEPRGPAFCRQSCGCSSALPNHAQEDLAVEHQRHCSLACYNHCASTPLRGPPPRQLLQQRQLPEEFWPPLGVRDKPRGLAAADLHVNGALVEDEERAAHLALPQDLLASLEGHLHKSVGQLLNLGLGRALQELHSPQQHCEVLQLPPELRPLNAPERLALDLPEGGIRTCTDRGVAWCPVEQRELAEGPTRVEPLHKFPVPDGQE